MSMHFIITLVSLGVSIALTSMGQAVEPQPLKVFTQLGLTSQQVASIDAGKPVAKILSWGKPSEVYVFGAVRVNGSPAAYLKAARNVNRFAGTQGYQGIGELPATATVADLATLKLDAEDIKALKGCKNGDCDVQLPSASIQTFHDAVKWSQSDVADQVNALARGMILDLLHEYRRGGNEALGEYRDKEHPARVADQFETMIGRAAALPDVMPELRQYLTGYPNAALPGADDFFYWEKVSFGMKPTIRVNHAVIYQTRAEDRSMSAVAIKQLYASHYFHTALDLSVCVSDSAKPGSRGFYLMTIKGSEQEGLTGAKGSILRKIVLDKTKSSLESALASIKATIEQSTPASSK